jgi:hypothetical protein
VHYVLAAGISSGGGVAGKELLVAGLNCLTAWVKLGVCEYHCFYVKFAAVLLCCIRAALFGATDTVELKY